MRCDEMRAVAYRMISTVIEIQAQESAHYKLGSGPYTADLMNEFTKSRVWTAAAALFHE